MPEKVASQTRVQPTCIIGIKKGGTKVFTNGKSRLSRFLSKFGPKLLSDFYDMTVNRQFSSKRWTKKRARFLVQLSKEKCPNMQTGCFQLPLLGSASSLVIYRTTSRIHLRLLQFNGVKFFLKALSYSLWCNWDFTRHWWNNHSMVKDNLNSDVTLTPTDRW